MQQLLTIIITTGKWFFSLKSFTNNTANRRHIRSTSIIGLICCFVPLCYAADSITNKAQRSSVYPTYPIPNYGTGPIKQLVQRGEYLVKIGDCISCHTNNPGNGKPFAGGLAINTPFGAFYSPNITPDKQTGIGNWSDEDFIRAMHEGISPAGQYYFPVFPYTSFTKVTVQDLLAIKTYLSRIPAVHQVNKPPSAPWPFSWRFAQLGWRMLYFHPGFYHYRSEKSPQWNRGAYLVQGLGHCGECHTPRSVLGAMKQKYYLTGAFIEGYWAPDITHLEFEQAPVKEVVNVFDKAELIYRAGPVRGPMAEVDHNSLMQLSQNDLNAIAIYLKSVHSTEPRLPEGVAGSTGLAVGYKVYKNDCAMCHNQGVAGAPMLYDTANWLNRLKQGRTLLYQHAINGLNNMPAKGGCVTCTDDDIKAAVNYILAGNENVANINKIAGSNVIPDTSIALGKWVYDKNCAFCHDEGKIGAPVLGNQKVWKPLLKAGIANLVKNTINGKGNMPPRGGCNTCTNSALIAAVKYMANKADPENNYSLW